MKVTTISNFRKDTKKFFDQVFADHDILLITRNDGQTIVAMTLDHYNELSRPSARGTPARPGPATPPTDSNK